MRVLIVSDIHGNLVALDTVLAEADPFDALWCLGDTVGYGPEPNACVERLRQRSAVAVAGNHDRAAADWMGIEAFNSEAAAAAAWTSGQLSGAAREYLGGLPECQVVDEFTLVHGSPRRPLWEYILNAETARANLTHFDTPFCLVGHTHIPSHFVRRTGRVQDKYAPPGTTLELRPHERAILNPGSVGQPRDADPRAAFMVLDTEARTVVWQRVEYDVAATQQQMARHGLAPQLIERLAGGW